MREIKAPEPYIKEVDKKYLFLAGSIEMGVAENWQQKIVKLINEYSLVFNYGLDDDLIILNPRRDDWDSSWTQSVDNKQFKNQVEWELYSLDIADKILIYFQSETKSPISLLELGLYANSGKLMVVCGERFWRKGNIDIVCKKYNIPMYNSLETAALYV